MATDSMLVFGNITMNRTDITFTFRELIISEGIHGGI